MKLQYPAEIDAHLSFAVLDNTPVTVTIDGTKVDGRLGFADSFGTVPFFARDAAAVSPDAEVRATYRLGNQVLEFVTRVIRGAGNRWQLRRPSNIEVTYTDSDDFRN